MYQICPKCKQPVASGETVCPRCDTVLEPVDSPKSRRRNAVYIILGVLALAVAAFWERDLGNYDDLVQGGVVFGAMIIGSFFWFYIRGRGGMGYPIR